VTGRVTNRTIAQTSLNGLQSLAAQNQKVKQEMSSGKAISKPSDDVVGTNNALQFRSDIKTNEQYVRSAQNGASWLAVQDGTLQSVSSRMGRLKELAVLGANTGANNQTALDAIAIEVEGIKDDIFGLSNTTYLGRPVFGASTDGSVAFTKSTTGTPPVTTYAYQGGAAEVTRRVAPNTDVQVSTAGTEVFGSGTDNLFAKLDTFVAALKSGDSAKIQQANTDIDDGSKLVRASLANVGSRAQQIDRLSDLATDRAGDLKNSLTTVEDIDIAEKSIEFNMANVAYQASLAVTAKAIQPTLVDFLR